MSNFTANINAEDVINQMEAIKNKPQQSTFDPKRYLNTKLGKDEDSKTLTVRLLPFSPEGGSCFFKVHMHNIQVSKEVTPSGWKMLPCPKKNGFADTCPLCTLASEAHDRAKSATSEEIKSKYMDVAKANFARNMWIVRCIERGHEEDGVKFWLFNDRTDGQGVKDKILNIFETRRSKIGKDGQPTNIFDLNNGKDLILTIARDAQGKTVINVTDDDEKSPLTDNEELGYSWINDPTLWSDMYKVKSYDYLEVIAKNGIPYYSKKHQKYMDKEEVLAELKQDTAASLGKPTMDYSTAPSATSSTLDKMAETVAQSEPLPSLATVNADDGEIDDLPF